MQPTGPADIALVDFDRVSEFIKPHIDALAISSNTPALYTDIQADCRSGRAFIFTDSKGFMVLKPVMRIGIPVLLIWAAFHSGGNAFARHQQFWLDRAADIGAQYLEFWTSRPGFARSAPRFGWRHCYSVLKGGTRLTVWRKSL